MTIGGLVTLVGYAWDKGWHRSLWNGLRDALHLLISAVAWYFATLETGLIRLLSGMKARTEPVDWKEVERLSKEYDLMFPVDYLGDGIRELAEWHERQERRYLHMSMSTMSTNERRAIMRPPPVDKSWLKLTGSE